MPIAAAPSLAKLLPSWPSGRRDWKDREYVNGTIGFVPLGAALGKSPKSLMRMLSPTGNPHLTSFFEIVAYLQKIDGVVLTVQGIAA